MAFLITFSVLLGGGLLWMGLFVALRESYNTTLNAIADWLSPEQVSGWLLYLAACAACLVPLFKRFLRKGHRQPAAPKRSD